MVSIRGFVDRGVGVLLALLVVRVFFGPEAPKPPRPRVSLPEHEARVVEFSPDSRVIVTDGASGGCVRDAASGRVLARLMRAGTGGPSRATDITFPRFTEDGRHVVVQLGGPRFGPEQTVTLAVFEVATGRECASFERVGSGIWRGSALPLAEYALSADGATLAFARSSGHKSGKVTVCDVATGKITAEFPGLPPLALTSDGGVLAHADPGSPKSSPAIRTLRPGRPVANRVGVPFPSTGRDAGPIAFSPDGKLLAAQVPGDRAWTEPRIELLDVASGRVLAALEPNLPLHNDWFGPGAAWFGPGAKMLFLEDLGGYTSSRRVQAWDLAAPSPRLALQGPSESFATEVPRAIIARWDVTSRWDRFARDNSEIKVFDLPSTGPRGQFLETGVHNASISPDGRLMAFASDRTELLGSPGIVGSVVKPFLIRLGFWRFGLSDLNPPSRDVHEIRFRDVATGRLVATIDRAARPMPPYSVMFSPDGKTLVLKYLPERFGGWNSSNPMIDWSVELWDVPSGRPGVVNFPLAAVLAASAVLAGAWFARRTISRSRAAGRGPSILRRLAGRGAPRP